MDQFFSHENHDCPPSLLQGGKLRLGSKADIMPCLDVETATPEASPLVDATFLDGAAVVQMLNLGTDNTFLGYAEQVFLPYVSADVENTTCVDIVWHVYQTIVQRDKIGATVYGEELFSLQRFQRTGRISCVWTTTIHNCLPSCYTRSPFYRERTQHCTQLMAMMCFALWHTLT